MMLERSMEELLGEATASMTAAVAHCVESLPDGGGLVDPEAIDAETGLYAAERAVERAAAASKDPVEARRRAEAQFVESSPTAIAAAVVHGEQQGQQGQQEEGGEEEEEQQQRRRQR